MSDKRRKADRLEAYRKGHRAEWLAALAVMLKGCRIVARCFKTPVGEVDLIARKRYLVIFVEVKACRLTNSARRHPAFRSETH